MSCWIWDNGCSWSRNWLTVFVRLCTVFLSLVGCKDGRCWQAPSDPFPSSLCLWGCSSVLENADSGSGSDCSSHLDITLSLRGCDLLEEHCDHTAEETTTSAAVCLYKRCNRMMKLEAFWRHRSVSSHPRNSRWLFSSCFLMARSRLKNGPPQTRCMAPVTWLSSWRTRLTPQPPHTPPCSRPWWEHSLRTNTTHRTRHVPTRPVAIHNQLIAW